MKHKDAVGVADFVVVVADVVFGVIEPHRVASQLLNILTMDDESAF